MPTEPSRQDRPSSRLAAITDRLGGLAFGGDYNPEQWAREVWDDDIALMQQSKVNLVTVGVFCWALVEPEPGRFEFEWLDDILDRLHAGGIAVDLATGTASPPPWFTTRQDKARLVDRAGGVRMHGGRQAYCPSSVTYREAAAAFTRQLVQRYVDHPAVVMWHLNNEYGCHNAQCFCDVSVEAFRGWLQLRYGTIAELNRCWGTAFWSQSYGHWSEVYPPGAVAYHTFVNPTQQLDWRRFCSHELLECFRAEARVVRDLASQPLTTNFMSFFPDVDYAAWAPEMDIVSNDDYLLVADGHADQRTAMAADLMRSLAGGDPWMLMEHSTSAVNWQPRNPAKAPGRMRRNSLQHVARGADAALFFQWRASAAGAEKFHSGLVPHAGTDSARWREVVELGETLARLAPLAGSRVAPSPVAIVYDWNSLWAADQDAHPSVDFSVPELVQTWHRELWRRNVGVDVVAPDADLSGYAAVLLPGLYLIDDATRERLAAFVRAGGTLAASYFSGVVDENDHIRLGGYPGALREILGVFVEEFNPLLADEQVELSAYGPGRIWSETARSTGAEVLSTYASGGSAGSLAVSRHAFGGGQAFYLGTELAPAGRAEVFDLILAAAGITVPAAPEGVELITREAEGRRWTFVLNHTDQPVDLAIVGRDLLGDTPAAERTGVGPGGAAVIELS